MKRILSILLCVSLLLCSAISLSSCTVNEEDGPKKVTEAFFEAAKNGDTDAFYDCLAPSLQKEIDAALALASSFGIGTDEIYEGLFSYTSFEIFKDCEFSINRVEFTDDAHEHATVYVDVDTSKCEYDLDPNAEAYTVKIDGKWYIEG